MVEGRGRPAGVTLKSAKSQTQRWQPLLPNLRRVNAAALASGRTQFTAVLHHVDVAALERAFQRQRRAPVALPHLKCSPVSVCCLT
jgi:RNA-directed DNA polymerase